MCNRTDKGGWARPPLSGHQAASERCQAVVCRALDRGHRSHDIKAPPTAWRRGLSWPGAGSVQRGPDAPQHGKAYQRAGWGQGKHARGVAKPHKPYLRHRNAAAGEGHKRHV